MTTLPQAELKQIGRDAARRILGAGKVKKIEVVSGDDWSGEPAYVFSFLYDQDRDPQQMGLLRTRLSQKLRDELLARDDQTYPFIHILSSRDWEKRQVA